MQTLSVPVHVSADVPSGSGPSTSTELEEWAAETTSAWMKEVKTEWKQLQRRETLVRFRANKKQRSAHMRCERDRLEREVKRRLAALHTTSVQDPDENGGSTSVAVCRLALESEALRTENVELHQKLQQLKRLWSLVQEGLVGVNASPMKHSTDVNLYKASKASVWVSCRPENEPGWRVHFPNGEPSFYFYPLTRQEFDAIYKASLDMFARMPQLSHPVGTLFGWTVYQAPLTRSPLDNRLVAHTKLSMRVGFSLEEVDALVVKSGLTWLPLIVVPPGWSDKQRDAVSVEVLQEFEKDVYIMVCNIPGKVHLRYLQLIRRQPQRPQNGKRSVTFLMAVANSNANARARAAEEPQRDVAWVLGGSNLLIVTEVDDNTTEITFQFQAIARDELHARQLLTYWAQFVCRWSGRIVPPRLIESESTRSR